MSRLKRIKNDCFLWVDSNAINFLWDDSQNANIDLFISPKNVWPQVHDDYLALKNDEVKNNGTQEKTYFD